ncbi:MAG: NAD(P)H-hydrate dehydratase [Desulfovibrionaceae bacterium]|nr:NAD(P)H-hydrate dehydratase [Desulfovibrionaceae bacterium]
MPNHLYLREIGSPLPTSQEMSALDAEAKKLGIPSIVLMENASQASVRLLQQRLPNLQKLNIYALVGSGNNGGDALCMARYLQDLGAKVSLFLTKDPSSYQGDAALELQIAQNVGLTFRKCQELFSQPKPDLLLDGLLGTGFKQDLRPDLVDLIEKINAHNFPLVVALDIPSGLDGNSGHPRPIALKAHFTITMAAPKLGLLQPRAKPYCGEILVAPIGLPSQILEQAQLSAFKLEPKILQVLSELPDNSYKNRFGHTLIIGGGSLELIGAAHLAAYAALRTGAGLVTCVVPKALGREVRFKVPEIMVLPVGEESWPENLEDKLTTLLLKAQSLVLGPGFGESPTSAQFLKAILNFPKRPPAVLDADALKLLACNPTLKNSILPFDILTPHPGEAALLLNTTNSEVQRDRVKAVQELANQYQCVCILKGANTLICEPLKPLIVSPFDIPQLAVAGAGDVLAGILGALLGFKFLNNTKEANANSSRLETKTYSPLVKAALAVYLHAKAGLNLELKFPYRGILAREIAEEIPAILNSKAS